MRDFFHDLLRVSRHDLLRFQDMSEGVVFLCFSFPEFLMLQEVNSAYNRSPLRSSSITLLLTGR